MKRRSIPADWLDSVQPVDLGPVIDREELIASLDGIFPDVLDDIAVAAVADSQLDQLWREIGSRHFGGALPNVVLAWAEGLKGPARLEDNNTILVDTRLMSGPVDEATKQIAMVLLHCAVLVAAKGYGPEFQKLATQIGAGMGLRPVRTTADARQWLFRRCP